jgi:hypothetical protein
MLSEGWDMTLCAVPRIIPRTGWGRKKATKSTSSLMHLSTAFDWTTTVASDNCHHMMDRIQVLEKTSPTLVMALNYLCSKSMRALNKQLELKHALTY